MNINPLIPESLDFTIEKISTTGVLPYRKEQASPSTRADSFPAQKRIILLGSLPSPESPSTPGHSIVASGQVDDSIKLTVCKVLLTPTLTVWRCFALQINSLIKKVKIVKKFRAFYFGLCFSE